MLVVAGLSIKNLEPRVWDRASEFYIPALSAVMVSYADFHQMQSRRKHAMEMGLRCYLGLPDHVALYLDNGAFYFGTRPGAAPVDEYEEFVRAARPDWKPIPQDYIPFPGMSAQKRRGCFDKTMQMNRKYQNDGYVPVIHIGDHLLRYTAEITSGRTRSGNPDVALGGIVPNLLRKPKAMPYKDILVSLHHVRQVFADERIHVFGIGGTATLHLAALLGFDSVDSSGWRNRAARGIIQLPGSGDRLVADLGNWRGRRLTPCEWEILTHCECPACRNYGTEGLRATKLHGFRCRAAHNLWVLLTENDWLKQNIADRLYVSSYEHRLDNSIYRPIVAQLLELLHS